MYGLTCAPPSECVLQRHNSQVAAETVVTRSGWMRFIPADTKTGLRCTVRSGTPFALCLPQLPISGSLVPILGIDRPRKFQNLKKTRLEDHPHITVGPGQNTFPFQYLHFITRQRFPLLISHSSCAPWFHKGRAPQRWYHIAV